MTGRQIGRRVALTAVNALLLGLAVTFSAGAAPGAGANLLVNGNAEQGEGVNDVNGIAADIPGWTRKGNFTVVKYAAPGGFPDATVQAAVRGGNNFFAGGPSNAGSSVSQDIDLSAKKALVSSGKARATLAGYLGGYASQEDSLIATTTFWTATGKRIGPAAKIGPVKAAERGSTTKMILKKATVPVPKLARTVRVTLSAARTSGSYNDGYADNLSLTVSR
jgi:hypothetical protein